MGESGPSSVVETGDGVVLEGNEGWLAADSARMAVVT